MSEDFTQLDELVESDVREALGEPALEQESETEILNVPEELMDEVIEPENVETPDEIETNASLEESDGEVLEDIGDIDILPMAEIESALDDEDEEPLDTTINSVNTSDLASLLSQLLNNKTIEITIKIKD
ncbi:MAG: hypothetical protein U9R39_01785 [Campylobacterota bacterium]|nr:hypothetical protein [Campylobacterota bacterium]